MKKNYLKRIAPVLACFCVVSCGNINNNKNSNNGNEEKQVIGGLSNELKSEYDMYEILEVPTYTFIVDGNPYTVQGKLLFPDGSISNEKSIFLNQSGFYKVKFMGKVGELDLYHEETFVCYKQLFSYNSTETKVMSYEIPDYARTYTNTNGVYVQLGVNDTLTLNEPINVSDLVADENNVGNNVVKGFFTPLERGTKDFSNLNFTLTDINNPDIYCTFGLVINNDYPGTVYWKGCASGQIMTGWNQEGNEPKSKLTTAGSLGSLEMCSYDATHEGSKHTPIDPSLSPFNYRFDSKSLTGYTNFSKGDGKPRQEIVRLNDPKAFSNLFSGFKSDKVKLSIKADGYFSKTANFCITDVIGVNLRNKYLQDSKAPDIFVQGDFDLNNMPKGKLGGTYPIPTATAIDDYDGKVDVSTSVYYGLNSKNPIAIDIDENNRFATKYKGIYTILYESVDNNGNISQELAQVHVGDDYEPITASISKTLKNCEAGERIEIPNLINLNGGSGNYEIKISAKHSSGEEGEIELSNDKTYFTPLEVGDWTITYEVTDFIGSVATFSKKIVASQSDNIVPIEFDTSIYDRMINGFIYDVPAAKAYVFNNGHREIIDCDVYINDVKYNVGDKFKPQVTTSGDSIKFVIKHGNDIIDEFNSYAVITYDSEKSLHAENLFYKLDGNTGSTVTTEKTNEGIAITQSDSSTKVTFHKKLIANEFSLGLKKIVTDDQVARFNSIKINITDIYNKDESLSVTLIPSKEEGSYNTASLVLNNDQSYVVDFTSTSTFGFNGSDVLYNSVKFGFETYDNGKEFNGFSSSFVYLTMQAEIGASTNDTLPQYAVISLNNHSFASKRDNSAPEYIIYGDYGGKFNVGDTYKTGRMIYNDIISPSSSASLTVTDKDGNIVTSKDGISLNQVSPDREYEIDVTTIGSYMVEYALSDACKDLSNVNNNDTFSYFIYCTDTEAPTIKITSSWTQNAKVGATIVMPNFEVSDNLTEAADITVYKSVRTPAGNILLLDGNSIVAGLTGTYVFSITAIDSYGNSNVMNFECVVK